MQDSLRERSTSELPPVRRKRKRFDPGWVFARAICGVFAFLGLVPIVLVFVVRSDWAHTWAARETELLAGRQGIPAKYDVDVKLWPVALELKNVVVESSDRLQPLLTSHRVRLRPKVFALLSGKLAIDSIEIDDPSVRLVIKGCEVQNLKLDLKKKDEGPRKPFEAPFNAVSVSNAELDLTIDDVEVGAHQVDLDVTAERDEGGGSDLEIALRAENATSRWARVTKDEENPEPAVDDDALCAVEGRVRIEPHAIIVRRLEAQGSMDLDVAPDTTPRCDLPQDDKRRVEISLGHVTVQLPDRDGALPKIDGHVRARAPIGFASRLVNFPECDGWVSVDTDVRFAQDAAGKFDLKALDASGQVEAKNVRLKQFNFAEDMQTDFAMHQGVITAKSSTVRTGEGVATFTNTTVEPLVPGGSLRSSLEIHDVSFTTLLRELGISQHPHVAWELRELHGPALTGTFDPLKIDMDFVGKTGAFAVYDGPADAPARNRIFGFSESTLQAHLAIRPDGVKFMGVHAQLPRSVLDNGFCSLGFHNDLRVDVPTGKVNLEDISPIGPVKMQGDLVLQEAHVHGVFNRPEPEGDIASITNYVVNDMAFGNVTGGHVAVDIAKPEVVITKVHATKNKSEYDVPTARLEFGHNHGFDIDAQAQSGGFDLRDLLQMFQLDDDPRFDQLEASIATHADVHVAVGGPEDKCGGGHIAVRAKSHLSQIAVHGETFASGDADLDFNWFDRDHGIAGADVTVQSFVLAKGGGAGTVLGSAEIRRGGALTGHLVVDGVPLSKITNLGAAARDMEGSVAAVAQITGNLDDFRDDAGIVGQVDVNVSPVRVRGVPLGQSHFGVTVTRAMPRQTRQVRTTGCGAPVGPPFDKVAARTDRSPHGDFVLDGDLFDGTVHATSLKMTWQDLPLVTGQLSFRGLDLGAALKIATPREQEGEVRLGKGSTANDITGQLFGELTLERVATDDLSNAKARFELKPTTVTRGGQKLTIPHPDAPIVVENDMLTVPPLEIRIETPGGFSGGIKVGGTVTRLVQDPTLALEADIEPIDLSILPDLVPQVDRASGHAEGKLIVTGKPRDPTVHGELHARADELAIHNAPSAFTDLKIDVASDEHEITATGKAHFGGGVVDLSANIPVTQGFSLGTVEASLKARGIHLTPAEGISASLDADLTLAYDPHATGDPASQLPQVGGEVDITSFDYTRPVSLTTDLSSSLGGKAKRTEVDTYDPSLNFIAIKDLKLVLKSPAKVKNNLVELEVAVDSGALTVNGTNQRVGLSGSLRTLPGGHFHFLRNDFEIQQGLIRFDDPTRIDPNVDVTAVTEYRRYSDASTTGVGAAGAGTAMGGALWRITVHAYGDADNLRFDLTSDPALAQEDIALLMTFGMTRAELDQMQASSVGAGIALNVLGATTGATSAVKEAIPVIDDFGFGSGTTRTGQTDPQVTVGKRLTDNVRATVTSGLSADRELRSNIEWRLTRRLSALGSYDNINDVSSSSVGNVGVDLRWRLEFQ